MECTIIKTTACCVMLGVFIDCVLVSIHTDCSLQWWAFFKKSVMACTVSSLLFLKLSDFLEFLVCYSGKYKKCCNDNVLWSSKLLRQQRDVLRKTVSFALMRTLNPVWLFSRAKLFCLHNLLPLVCGASKKWNFGSEADSINSPTYTLLN